jgi:hypothetical protein
VRSQRGSDRAGIDFEITLRLDRSKFGRSNPGAPKYAQPLFSQQSRESKTDGRASWADEIKEFVLLKQGRLGLAFLAGPSPMVRLLHALIAREERDLIERDTVHDDRVEVAKMMVETTVVATIFGKRFGICGALSALPGVIFSPASSEVRTPIGNTANSTVHQIMK